MQQSNFNDDAPQIISPNEPHMACLLLLDVSGSMAGEPINSLNAALNRFKEEVCEDKRTREVLDIAILPLNGVPLNDPALGFQDWVPIESMRPVTLVASDGTAFDPAIRLALELIDERVRFYKGIIGPNFYKPWIVMITDGAGGLSEEVAMEVRRLDSEGKLSFWALGVDNYNPRELHRLTERVMRLKDKDFASFFNWVSKSMRSVSTSTPGERPQGVALPANVDKDVADWM